MCVLIECKLFVQFSSITLCEVYKKSIAMRLTAQQLSELSSIREHTEVLDGQAGIHGPFGTVFHFLVLY